MHATKMPDDRLATWSHMAAQQQENSNTLGGNAVHAILEASQACAAATLQMWSSVIGSQKQGRSVPVNNSAIKGGGVSRLGLLHRRGGGCCSGGLAIWVCLLIALLQCWPLDGTALLQPDLSLALQQLMLAGSRVNLHTVYHLESLSECTLYVD